MVKAVELKNIVLLIATLSAFLTPFMGSSVNVAMPSMGKEFSMNAVTLSWVATAYLLASAVFLVPFGKLADIVGRRKIYTLGIAVFTLSSFWSMFAGSSVSLILSRALQGAGSALIFGTSLAMLTSVFPPGERGRALGINVASVYIGLSCGPFLGGFLTYHFGWRSIFIVSAVVGGLTLLLIFWKLHEEWAEAKGDRFDLFGSAIYGLMLVGIIYGFSHLPENRGWWFSLGGFVFALGFIAWEYQVANPILNLELFLRNRVFAFSNLAALINYCATFAVGFLLSLYLQEIRGLDPQMAGLVLMAQPIMQAIFSPFAGKLSDKVESQKIASWGMTMTAVGLLLLCWLSDRTPMIGIISCLMLLGVGFAFFSSPNTNAVMSSVDKRYYGVASATLGTMRLTGQMFSMGIAMMIFSVVIGQIKISSANHMAFMGAVHIAFFTFGTLCVLGVFASLSRGKLRPEN
jgi:EmrB/QacA subfamily drug resistance transporter